MPGSQWRLTTIDGEPLAGTELILTVLADNATLSSVCGASIASLTTNEGGRLRFSEFEGPGGNPQCGQRALETHARALDALQGVEGLQPAAGGLELRGDHLIRLEQQRTDT